MNCPVSFEELVGYWAGDLPPEVEAAVDEHLMGCAGCTRESARVAAMTETLRNLIPPLISRQRADALAKKGLRVLENPMQPNERREVVFPGDVDILLHRLGGMDLGDAVRVSFILRDERTGRVMVRQEEAPFERESGEVLVACQAHYAALPPDTVAEVRAHDAAGVETLTSYTILHRFEGYAP
jgi:hypothetical protein